MDMREIIERIDCVKATLEKAFDIGALDLDKITNELGDIKRAAILLGDGRICSMKLKMPEGGVSKKDICVENFK